MSRNLQTGALSGNKLLDFAPVPEETGSFETGIESLFLNNRLSFDFTFYNTVVDISTWSWVLLVVTELLNSAKVRNTGFETTIGYDSSLEETFVGAPTTSHLMITRFLRLDMIRTEHLVNIADSR